MKEALVEYEAANNIIKNSEFDHQHQHLSLFFLAGAQLMNHQPEIAKANYQNLYSSLVDKNDPKELKLRQMVEGYLSQIK